MNAALVPHQRGKGFSTIALTVVALLCAGCAALVVDVDVYKGPLANTEEIQGEQVMALAMGAKPLLVQLRDHLEVEGGPPADPALGQHRSMSPNRSEIDAALGRLRLSKFYAAGYMPAGNGRDAYAFRNELAIRVNEILGLYEDQADPAVRSTLTEVRELIGEYRRAHDVLEPPSNAIWRSQWRRWKKGLAPKAERTLVSCYDEFFDVERSGGISWRSKTRVMDGVFDGRRMVSTHSVNPSSSGVPMSLEMTNHLAWFETFREVAIHQHAPALFGQEESPERAAFVGAIESICDAYTDSRTALRRLFRLTLISLRELGALPPGRLDEGKSRSVAKVLADASVRLVDADKLALYRHRLSSPGLLALADSSALALAASGTSEPSPLEYARIRGVTVEELARPGSSVAAELLDLDEEVAAGSGGLSYPFGLVRGPTSALESIEDVLGGKSGASGLISALSRTGGPLDGGRLREGLEASITRYLAAAEGAEPANRLELPEARNLLAALVAYGQKVAQLGNSVVLLRLSSSSSVRQYVTVLQAVGNSILVHVDELKQQGLHHRRLQQRSQLVARALEEHAGQTNTGLGNW
ncbi:MAG: hypothetical protein JNL97_12665, partial [Verrucomicrobiales bacterium]|nr:hypothetical protein [Verrucomicrobiales bacterium]